MNLRETLRQTVVTFRANKMRSFLTMFGIIWGISSVIILVGLGKGFSSDQHERMKSLGKDLVIIWGGRTSMQAGGRAAGREIQLTIDDARLIKSECYLVKDVSPELRRTLPEVSTHNQANRSVSGIWPAYQDFRSLLLWEGRLLTEEDEREGRRVVLLGSARAISSSAASPTLARPLPSRAFLTPSSAHSQRKSRIPITTDPTTTFCLHRTRDRPRLPSSGETWDHTRLPRQHRLRGWRSGQPRRNRPPSPPHAGAHAPLRSSRRGCVVHLGHDGWSQAAQTHFDMITLFFACVAIMTLCLGGIGVMNIMLVSVTERTREIGVRKAMGATKADILKQFFAESAMLTVVSGGIGLGFGVGLCVLMALLPLPDFVPKPAISTLAVVASVLTLSLITFTAGMYPARRAAEMEPVESLRYE